MKICTLTPLTARSVFKLSGGWGKLLTGVPETFFLKSHEEG